MFTTTRIITIAALATAAYAQSSSLDQLSATCKTAITTLANDSNASACLGVQNLEAIATLVLGNSTDSIVGPVNTWLTGICAASACTNDTLNAVVNSLETGCDLELPTEVVAFYPTIRSALCLQEAATNCITQTLTSIEKAIGTIDAAKIQSLFNFDNTTIDVLSSATGAYCTECTKNISSTISNAGSIPEQAQVGFSPLLEKQCGASFIGGSTASSTSTGATSSSTAKSGALGAVAILSQSVFAALGASGFVAVSTVFTFLA